MIFGIVIQSLSAAPPIFLKDVLDEMAKGEPFSMTFVTYDGKRKRMGELIEVESAKCTWKEKSAEGSKNKAPEGNTEVVVKTRQPNHWENATRNIVINGTQIRKVHIRLITKFNGKTVIW
jgi:hypothetical protein